MKNVIRTGLRIGLVAGIMAGAATALAGTWSSYVSISNLEVDDTGTGSATYLTFSTTPSGKPGCGTSGQVVSSGSADYVKSMTAIATTAFLAGRGVRVWFDGTCATGGFARFTGLAVQ